MRPPVRPLDRHSLLFTEVDRMAREQIALGSRALGRLYQAIAHRTKATGDSHRGAAEALTRAVASPTGGFDELLRLGRVDLAMEWVVLDPRWEFPAHVRAVAHARLLHAAQRPISGAIAEATACRLLRLTPAASRVQADYDATDATGATYQIKARTVTSLAAPTPFDFKRPPSGFDHFVGVLLTPAGLVLAVFHAPLAAIQRRCKRSADGLRFRWTSDLLTADWLVVVRKASRAIAAH